MRYTNLRAYTSASLQFGLFDIENALQKVKNNPDEYSNAWAVTEHNNMFSIVKFSKAAKGVDGFNPIFGIELTFSEETEQTVRVKELGGYRDAVNTSSEKYDLLLIAKSRLGYQNLCKLQTLFFQHKKHDRVTDTLVKQHPELFQDVFVLSGGAGNNSYLFNHYLKYRSASDNDKPAILAQMENHMAFWQSIAGQSNYLVELQREGREFENEYIKFILPLTVKHSIPVVATNNTYFLERKDFVNHELLVANKADKGVFSNHRTRLSPTPENYLKSNSEMSALFADIPIALENTNLLASQCNVDLELGKQYYLPSIESPRENESLADFFVRASVEGMDKRLLGFMDTYLTAPEYPIWNDYFMQFEEWKMLLQKNGFNQSVIPAMSDEEKLGVIRQSQLYKTYKERLDYELGVIEKMGFTSYFLVVADFIQWSKDNGVAVGPGRGSGAGSLVAYSLSITDLDPLQFGLLFERFLNPERVSMPDFDIDFSSDERYRVLQYVRNKYNKNGEIHVSQIMNVGRYELKSSIEMAAKAYGMRTNHFKVVEMKEMADIADKPADENEYIDEEELADELSGTFKEAFEKNKLFPIEYRNAPLFKNIMDAAGALYHNMRNTGIHAAGIVISPQPLDTIVPVMNTGAGYITQLNKDDSEAMGLIKFDFLSLKNLDVIQNTLNFINASRKEQNLPLMTMEDMNKIDLYDRKVYEEIFQNGHTHGVFQFASNGMRRMLMEAKPTKFDEIVAFNALYRPGPMDNIPDFTARMQGEKFEYIHPLLQPVLESTYGIMVYQEQVMQAAQIIGGYTLGGADLLRRAMGKKKAEEMAKHREIFAKGAAERGISQEKADEIFNYMEKFAGYGFNKSHAAAYSMIAFQTAWLKTYYPREFMTATLYSDILNESEDLEVAKNISECVRMGITVKPVDINESGENFYLNRNGEIVMPFTVIKGFNQGMARRIISTRDTLDNGFTSIADFVRNMFSASLSGVSQTALKQLLRAGAFDSLENRLDIASALKNAEALVQNIANEMPKVSSPLLRVLPSSMIKQKAKANKQLDYEEVKYPLSAKERVQNMHKMYGFVSSNQDLFAYMNSIKDMLSIFSTEHGSMDKLLSSVEQVVHEKNRKYHEIIADGDKATQNALRSNDLMLAFVLDEYIKYDTKHYLVMTDKGLVDMVGRSPKLLNYKFSLLEPYALLVSSTLVGGTLNDGKLADGFTDIDSERINFEVKDIYPLDVLVSFTKDDKPIVFNGMADDLLSVMDETDAIYNEEDGEKNNQTHFDVVVYDGGEEHTVQVIPNGHFVNEMKQRGMSLSVSFQDSSVANGLIDVQELQGFLTEAIPHENMVERMNKSALNHELLHITDTGENTETGLHLLYGYITEIRQYQGIINAVMFTDLNGKQEQISVKNMPTHSYTLYQPCVAKVEISVFGDGKPFIQMADLYYENDLPLLLKGSEHHYVSIDNPDEVYHALENDGAMKVKLADWDEHNGYSAIRFTKNPRTLNSYLDNNVVVAPTEAVEHAVANGLQLKPLCRGEMANINGRNAPAKLETDSIGDILVRYNDILELPAFPLNHGFRFGLQKDTDRADKISDLMTNGSEMAQNYFSALLVGIVSRVRKTGGDVHNWKTAYVQITDNSGSMDFKAERAVFDVVNFENMVGKVALFKIRPSISKSNGKTYYNLQDVIPVERVTAFANKMSFEQDFTPEQIAAISQFLQNSYHDGQTALLLKENGKPKRVGNVLYSEALLNELANFGVDTQKVVLLYPDTLFQPKYFVNLEQEIKNASFSNRKKNTI